MTELDWSSLKPEKVVRNDLGECSMFYVSLSGLGDFLIFHFRGRVDYVKVMRPFSGKWDCLNALYNPSGLFAYDLGRGPFLEVIRKKMEAIGVAERL
jgi:hypothetical protein